MVYAKPQSIVPALAFSERRSPDRLSCEFPRPRSFKANNQFLCSYDTICSAEPALSVVERWLQIILPAGSQWKQPEVQTNRSLIFVLCSAYPTPPWGCDSAFLPIKLCITLIESSTYTLFLLTDQ